MLIFLNELTWTFDKIARERWPAIICSAIQAARSIRKLRADFSIAIDRHVNHFYLGTGIDARPLNAIIGGNQYEEEWTFLREVMLEYPNEDWPQADAPPRVLWNGIDAEGLTQACAAGSFVISFGYPPHWDHTVINADLTNPAVATLTPIEVRNIANPDNVSTWTNEISECGLDFSNTSLVYEDANFAVRMYLRDHNPPHVHVFADSHSRTVLARLHIRNIELMEGSRAVLPYRARLFEWARDHQEHLIDSWERCRAGRPPVRIL